MSAPLPPVPPEPESLEHTGLPESLIEQLILKILYFRGELYGQDLSTATGLKFSVIQDLVEALKLRHHLEVKRSLGMGGVGALYALTEGGRSRAREHLESNQYSGPAPVPLSQYAELVRRQRPREGWLAKEVLAKAFRTMVVTDRVLSQIGPAVASGNSLLLYGKPGDGKTFLIESLANLETASIFVPYAIECQGNIVQVYDPIYHERLAEEQRSTTAISLERSYDRRWARCKRPFIVSGGELTMDMLDLRFNDTSRVYEAPFQLKANNGIYLVDDFGRQRATPAEVLNRWIVPMERRVDYLSFLTGGKMTAPFEAFLVFSTNLNPEALGDEAFLRRIQYKMLLPRPSETEFAEIFERFCAARRLAFPRALIENFIDKHYRRTGKVLRRCHPRDVLTHALNLIHFERLPVELTEEVLDRAFESCFLQEHDDEAPSGARILEAPVESCLEYWSERLARAPTIFGKLAQVASFRSRPSERYHSTAASHQYEEAETAQALEQLHNQTFAEWLALSLEQQRRDLGRYLSSEDGAAHPGSENREALEWLAPAHAVPENRQQFMRDLAGVLDALSVGPASWPA